MKLFITTLLLSAGLMAQQATQSASGQPASTQASTPEQKDPVDALPATEQLPVWRARVRLLNDQAILAQDRAKTFESLYENLKTQVDVIQRDYKLLETANQAALKTKAAQSPKPQTAPVLPEPAKK